MPPFLLKDNPFLESYSLVSSFKELILAYPTYISNSFLKNKHLNALI